MSALARWFNAAGYKVAGYDRARTELSAKLEGEGIGIHYIDDVAAIADEFKKVDSTLVIYTPAVPANHSELVYFRENGFQVKKRSQVLGLLSQSFFTIAIAGTHGKTTTTSMTSHVLKEAGKNVFAFVGGISQNYSSNLLLGDSDKEDRIMVVEADEFDRSFLTLHPNIAIITSMDPDHLDIYHSADAVTESFREFAGQVDGKGYLIYKEELPLSGAAVNTFSFGESGDYRAENIHVDNGAFVFDIFGKDTVKGIRLQVPGYHNVMNALAAYAAATLAGVSPQDAAKALETFKGVKRRFEYIHRGEDLIYLDDYAHHPVEIEAFVKGVKALYPEKPLHLIFQPHLYSRTRDFMESFASSLSMADEVILLPVYPAREEPIPGITSEKLLERINARSKKVVQKQDLLNHVKEIHSGVIATVGAGDIDQFVEPIKTLLSHEKTA